MIESLTEEQEAQMDVYGDKWIEIGLATGPANRDECIKYAKIAYAKAGLPPPTKFIFTASPMDAIEKIEEITGEARPDILSGQMYGNQDAYWLSYYDYFLNVVGISECSVLEGLFGVAKHCGWWSAYEDFAVFQDRPTEIHRNEEGNLHNESGPAVLYSDGFDVWCINGYRVTEQIVMRPETLTINQINSETNADVQSIMIDRFGWPRYLEETGAKVLDFRSNVVENTLESLFATDKYGLRLLVTCPTGRVFVKGIPSNANIKTCEDAQRWLGNDTSKKYNVIART